MILLRRGSLIFGGLWIVKRRKKRCRCDGRKRKPCKKLESMRKASDEWTHLAKIRGHTTVKTTISSFRGQSTELLHVFAVSTVCYRALWLWVVSPTPPLLFFAYYTWESIACAYLLRGISHVIRVRMCAYLVFPYCCDVGHLWPLQVFLVVTGKMFDDALWICVCYARVVDLCVLCTCGE